ncbi:uncharacterized protein LOC110737053 [Chenopodium quinoa]|uniref:Myelin-associated oligodendrocyte basic protein n=1 Tax=Chenopodium quinoa TaxID=63459 RepID=A0A803KPL8_CHEQI|nr:uncharacterized protein LOC110737053 [Chenopodium quinoa]XP_021773107.1 uncharacterized protein LOC110737053 [Chenopodium quinoa]
MATALLLEPSALTTTKHPTFLSPQSTPLLRPYPIRLTSLAPFSSPSINPKFSPKPFKFTPKCDAKNPNSPDSELGIKEKTLNSIGFVLDKISEALKALKKPAIAALLVGALLMYDPNSAFAASGGRMGGRSFSSRSSMSGSQSYSVRPSSPGFSQSVPYFAPSPFGGAGLYVGPAFGVGAGSSLFFIMMGFAAFILVSGFLSDRSDGGVLTATERTTVIKLQVGLLGMARSLQSDLNRIAEVADTSTPEGLNFVLTETMLALLRHPDYCISAYSSVDIKKSIEEGEKRFNQLSIEERGKFDEETLVNVNNLKRQSTKSTRASGYSNEYIVITILVAAEGVVKMPTINGSLDLKEALQKLGSIPSSKTMAVEVLWTPQNENDTLSERELLEDYPLLKPL